MARGPRAQSQVPLPPMEVTPVDHSASPRSTAVEAVLLQLRQCVADCGWTYDALEAAMGKDKAHIHRVLHGEKAMTLDFLIALPDDIEALFEKRRAEAFGFLVVAPDRDPQTAAAHLVSGLLGLLVPAKAA